MVQDFKEEEGDSNREGMFDKCLMGQAETMRH